MVNIYIGDSINRKAVVYTITELFRYIDQNFNIVEDISESHVIYIIKGSMIIPDNTLVINASELLWCNYLDKKSLPVRPLHKNGNAMPFLYKDDIIASAFFMLSGYEEYISERRDKFDRFLFKYSYYKRDHIYDQPIVELYRNELIRLINSIDIICKRVNIWKGSMGLFLTHDVDGVHKYRFTLPSLLKSALKPSKFSVMELIRSKIDVNTDPYYQGFSRIISKSKEMGFKSTFFFITNPTCKLDDFYDIGDSHIEKVINDIKNSNFEIGLHGSVDSYNCKDVFRIEHERMTEIWGVRQHYLKYNLSVTSRIQSDFLSYDSTLGFADMAGYRRGTCLPFKLFDLDSNSNIDLFELPLLVMDQTLKSYMNFDKESAYAYILQLIEQVYVHNGLFTFLWHPGNCSDEWEDWFNHVYIRILDSLVNKNCESVLGQEVVARVGS